MAVRLLKLGFEFVVWFAIPTIALVVLYMTRRMTKYTEDKRHRSAMQSGFWAGFILFLIALIYQVGLFLKFGFPRKDIYDGFNIWLAAGTAIIAFSILVGGKQMVSARFAGLGVLLIIFLACYLTIHYLFIRTYNEIILSTVLGGAFGVLCHFAVSTTGSRRS